MFVAQVFEECLIRPGNSFEDSPSGECSCEIFEDDVVVPICLDGQIGGMGVGHCVLAGAEHEPGLEEGQLDIWSSL